MRHHFSMFRILLEILPKLNFTIFITMQFFFRIQIADPEYKKAFDDELVSFKERIKRRAKEKIAEQIKEEEEEEEKERQERIAASPGGLDPIEVLESLPEDLRR